MAYNLGERFPPTPRNYTLLDPGAYQKGETSSIATNKAPFLTKSPRNTQTGIRIWTHAIYHGDFSPKIPNCTTLMSKRPRFPYEALSKEDLEEILCKCGVQNVCECTSEDIKPDFNCQTYVPRRLFKGHPPRSHIENGLSVPSKRDQGFKINSDGSQKRVRSRVSDESPPFYDIRVDEFTAFYQGCKWSRWTSKRSSKEQIQSPGPSDYTLERNPTYVELCAEKVRAQKRKTSKQLRFIEMVHQRNISEGQPGPATYRPKLPEGTNLQYLGPKADRFPESSEQCPGPADHLIKRDFDVPIPPINRCRARLPKPSFFGIKAQRFKHRKEEGPSPATYNPSDKECLFMHCRTAPFGSSSVRFRQHKIEEADDLEVLAVDNHTKNQSASKLNVCPKPTWEFRSKTIRLKPLENKWHEPSPADLPQSNRKVVRLPHFQYIAPFSSSEGRFCPWNDWLPVFGKYETPGPCYYEAEKPKCYPAVYKGPLFRSNRFSTTIRNTPGPEYKVGKGVETVLSTYNQRLKDNIDNQHKFHWVPPTEEGKLSFEEQESVLLQKSIALLESDIFDPNTKKTVEVQIDKERKKPKLLRCFLYSHPTPKCT